MMEDNKPKVLRMRRYNNRCWGRCTCVEGTITKDLPMMIGDKEEDVKLEITTIGCKSILKSLS